MRRALGGADDLLGLPVRLLRGQDDHGARASPAGEAGEAAPAAQEVDVSEWPSITLSDGTVIRVDTHVEPGHAVLHIEAESVELDDEQEENGERGTAYVEPDPASLRLLAGFLQGLADQMDRDAERARG
jgi:hypothetical protein